MNIFQKHFFNIHKIGSLLQERWRRGDTSTVTFPFTSIGRLMSAVIGDLGRAQLRERGCRNEFSLIKTFNVLKNHNKESYNYQKSNQLYIC